MKKLKNMLVVGVACISFSSASYAALSPEGPRYLSRSCTAPDDNYVKGCPHKNAKFLPLYHLIQSVCIPHYNKDYYFLFLNE
jgi:hypothetical protein